MMDKISVLFTRQVIIAIIIFSLTLCLLIFLLQLAFSSSITVDRSDRYQVMITPADEVPNNKQDGQQFSEEITATPRPEGVVEVGMQAVVYGTENRGLRMRQNAGFDAPVTYLAVESERLEIIDGPDIEDGYIWWKLRSMDDPVKVGWSVQDFLQIDGQ